jgi:DNA-binding IscR family transcriptional regulator
MLAQKPDSISVGDVIRIMEGNVGLTACCDKKLADDCPRKEFCTTRSVWIKASQVLENELNSISLQDIIDGNVHPIE